MGFDYFQPIESMSSCRRPDRRNKNWALVKAVHGCSKHHRVPGALEGVAAGACLFQPSRQPPPRLMKSVAWIERICDCRCPLKEMMSTRQRPCTGRGCRMRAYVTQTKEDIRRGADDCTSGVASRDDGRRGADCRAGEETRRHNWPVAAVRGGGWRGRVGGFGLSAPASSGEERLRL